MHVWALWLSCETPAQTCTCDSPGASKTPPKFNEKTHSERQKERNWGWETEKKARNFGPPTLRGPTHRGGPPFGPDFLWVWAPPFGAMTHTRSRNGLAKIGFGQNWLGQNHDGQKWIGQNWSNQDGQNGIGRSRSLPWHMQGRGKMS